MIPSTSDVPDPPSRLFDERAEHDFRTVFGHMARSATRVDVALTRIRLSTLDFGPGELGRLRKLRLLLAEVNATGLDVEAHGLLRDRDRGRTLRHLAVLLEDGVIEVRAAPLAGWSPDFTVFGTDEGPRAVLLGFHWMQRPFPHRGPALASLHGPRGARLAARRFAETWSRAHDVGPAVLGILERARGVERGVSGEGVEAQRAQRVSAGRNAVGPP